ncbi:MAG: AI-2E family transporter [Verrucomicrobia bacterium]|nr:AI-2E family transporter [Verrucomicrobiota bacterium]
MTRAARISYAFMFILLVIVAWMNMATPLITALFAYFALDKLNVTGKKWLTVSLFVMLVAGVLYAFAHFTKEAVVALPEIVEKSVPRIVAFAEEKGLPLPYGLLESQTTASGSKEAQSLPLPYGALENQASEDLNRLTARELRKKALEAIKENFGLVGNFAKNFAKSTAKQFVFLIIGLVVAASLFINPKMELERERRSVKNNLYSLSCDEIATRFRNFYRSFATVMGAQITISAINTMLTAIFVLSVQLPYSTVVIGVTFLCGLLPIIGNIISNSVIVGIGFTISPQLAIAALVFLVLLHKLEYFLNSKIIGDRIKNPVWLTLLGLILGERIMGIPGMILAPVVLHYIKMETARIQVTEETEELAIAGGNGPGSRGREFDTDL